MRRNKPSATPGRNTRFWSPSCSGVESGCDSHAARVSGISRIHRFAAVNTPTALDAAFFRCHASRPTTGAVIPIPRCAAQSRRACCCRTPDPRSPAGPGAAWGDEVRGKGR
jgi:hypothetical protein